MNCKSVRGSTVYYIASGFGSGANGKALRARAEVGRKAIATFVYRHYQEEILAAPVNRKTSYSLSRFSCDWPG
jgi:hypothetical protein